VGSLAEFSSLVTAAEEGARHSRPVARIVGAPHDIARKPGDWCWQGDYDKSVFAPMTDEQADEEDWAV
jgi:hypothetical protein